MVTQSSSRSASTITSNTSSGGTSMSMVASTMLMDSPLTRRGERLPGADRLLALPLPQRALHGGVEGVAAHAQQARGRVVAGQQVGLQGAHERADELRVRSGHLGRDAVGDRRG